MKTGRNQDLEILLMIAFDATRIFRINSVVGMKLKIIPNIASSKSVMVMFVLSILRDYAAGRWARRRNDCSGPTSPQGRHR